MSSWLNRERKRRMRKGATLNEVKERFENVKAQVASAIFTIPVSILYEKYGWSVDECNAFNMDIVDKYNEIDDTEQFQVEFYLKTGIGILKKEDEEDE